MADGGHAAMDFPSIPPASSLAWFTVLSISARSDRHVRRWRIWEVLFCTIRKHEVAEGLLVTGFLFPLVLPATIPLWQVAMGISFGVVLGKEIFGGTGMNFLNVALLSRAFLFFAYPGEISGDAVWIAAGTSADGVSGATWLAVAAEQGQAALASGVSWGDAFFGLIPGSMGETSALACLIGAAILILAGVGSWRIMARVTIGTLIMAIELNPIGSNTILCHLLVGAFASVAGPDGCSWPTDRFGRPDRQGALDLRLPDRRPGGSGACRLTRPIPKA